MGCSNAAVFSKLYTFPVRPILEYATSVWSPYLVKDIEALEEVQKRASRLAFKQKRGEMSYQERCKLLKWDIPEKRRRTYRSLWNAIKQ